MHVSEFDFDLPPELIAQEPAPRGASKLLVLDRSSGGVRHHIVSDVPQLLRRGDLLVVNDTRVFPARLLGRRQPTGGRVECMLVRRVEGTPPDPGSETWEALMHPGQKLKPGARVIFEGAGVLHGEVLERHFYGRRTIRLWTEDRSPVAGRIDALGHIPLPPYIHREDRDEDRERYQTIFARERGSIAAPTAGLHFTPGIVEALAAVGVEQAAVTLHVGYGTFKPVRVEHVDDHVVDPEPYEITPGNAATIDSALSGGRRVVAVGTTTTRALETAIRAGAGRIGPGRGTADLFIHPPFDFRAAGALLTNFHLPRSSLLMLVAAFAGRERLLDAYRTAVEHRYRFYSYGDAMLIF
jgi:S-adenosylmethionine:tRNA ribosyltransferase-isomerase